MNRNIRTILPVCFVLTLLTGCGPSVIVESNLNPIFRSILDRTLVVIHTPMLDEYTERVDRPGSEFTTEGPTMTRFSDRLSKEMKKKFTEAGVEARFYVMTGLELTDVFSLEEAAGYQRHEILFVKESFIGKTTESELFGLLKETSITQVNLDSWIPLDHVEDELAWRGKVHVGTGSGGDWAVLSKNSAVALVDLLIADGVVIPAAPSK